MFFIWNWNLVKMKLTELDVKDKSGHIAVVMYILYGKLSILLTFSHCFLVMFLFILYFSSSAHLPHIFCCDCFRITIGKSKKSCYWRVDQVVFKGPSQPKPLCDSMSQLLYCIRQVLQWDPLKKKHWVSLLALNRWLKGTSWKTFKCSKRYWLNVN